MTANELRIGNWVMFDGLLDVIIEIGQANNGFCQRNGYFNFDSGSVQPIPLTPEILKKAGFKRHRCGISAADMWQGMDGWSIDNPFFEGWLFRGGGYSLKLVGYYNSDIRYLHQLQNLYFALTGEELKIDL